MKFLGDALVKVWAAVGPAVLTWISERIARGVSSVFSKKDVEAKAEADREQTEKAETPKEREDAAENNRRL